MANQSDKRRKLQYYDKQFADALKTLAIAVHEPDYNEYVRDAVIQRFEYTIESGRLKRSMKRYAKCICRICSVFINPSWR